MEDSELDPSWAALIEGHGAAQAQVASYVIPPIHAFGTHASELESGWARIERLQALLETCVSAVSRARDLAEAAALQHHFAVEDKLLAAVSRVGPIYRWVQVPSFFLILANDSVEWNCHFIANPVLTFPLYYFALFLFGFFPSR